MANGLHGRWLYYISYMLALGPTGIANHPTRPPFHLARVKKAAELIILLSWANLIDRRGEVNPRRMGLNGDAGPQADQINQLIATRRVRHHL